ncbi:TPA_asm: L [Carrot gammacytorhabdovirus 1]|nr:TPA_asm: L [Carrot gammacytorhabdovirus 1]
MEYIDESEEYRRKYRGLRDYHLRSALTTGNLKEEDFGDWEKNIKREIKTFRENFKVCERDPCAILGYILLNSPTLPTYNPYLYHAGACLETEAVVYKSMRAPLLERAGKALKSEVLHTKYFVPSQFFQRAITISNAINAEKPLPKNVMLTYSDNILGTVTQRLELLGITLIIGSECFAVRLNSKKISIHHVDHLKNWSDKLTERFNIELSCIFGHSLNPSIYPSVDLIYRFWGIWDRTLLTKGTKCYKCVKIFEAMVIGVLIEKNPNTVISNRFSFLRSTIEDFSKGLSDEDKSMTSSVEEMLQLLCEQDSMQYLSQLYGLYRTWGHPIVDPKKGIAKVYTVGNKKKVIDDLLPRQIRRIFMYKYAIWYKGAKGKYPDVNFSVESKKGNIIRDSLINNISTLSLKAHITHSDWDEVRFQKCIEIPKTFNLAEMVADKAVSPDRDALFGLCERGGSLYDANLKRGVIQWMMRKPENCEDFLNRVNNTGLSLNEMIIGLYQKEREVNETPRMFAVMGHAVRNFVVTSESMISEDILKAFPNITMTDSLLSLSKKIYSVSHRQSLNSRQAGFSTFKDVTIIVNIDFEKWNLNFRRETTFPLFEAMGDLYGLEHLYNRTYDIFENSLIYLADGKYRPKIDKRRNVFILDPPYCYTGHKGGFEGLRQKGWTVFTDCGLELICARHKCSYTIMGQGDNQVLALTWRTYSLDGERNVTKRGKKILTDQFNDFMGDMMTTFDELGLPMKALETWSSENLFLYGKFPTLRGVPLSMSLKKICRAYHLANEEIMTLDCSLATIQSNAMAACMSDVTSYVPYVIYKIQLFLAIKSFTEYHVLLGCGAFDSKSGDNWKFTSSSGLRMSFVLNNTLPQLKMATLLTWFPKILGGISVASWYDFLMRGFPDKVSSSLTWVYHLMNVVHDEDYKRVLNLIYQCHINPERNFTLLVEDPCALNLVVPVDARASLKQTVQELFENISEIRNVEFASLFSFNREWDRRTFCEKLCEGGVIHPRFLHDIAAATLGGYVDGIVSKVSKSSTISKMSLKASSMDPGEKIERNELNYMKYLQWKFSRSNTESSRLAHTCPTDQARYLRIHSWDRVLEGVTVPHPMAFLKFRDCARSPVSLSTCDMNYIMISLPESFSKGDLGSIHELGASPPYLGSETKEKLGADPTRQVFGKEPLIARPLNLLRVVNWFVTPGSNAESIIFKLLTSVSNLNPSDYVSKEMGITGSESHRYRDQALKHGVMSANMYTLGSHMHISTDPWVKYSRGTDNYTINYQALLCTTQALIGAHIFYCRERGLIPSREYHFHESCNSCIHIITDKFHDVISEEVIKLIPSGKGNPYLWVDEASLSLKYKHDPQMILNIEEMGFSEYIGIKNKREILNSWIASSIIEDILTSEKSGSGPRLLESKDYPRVMYKKLSVRELWEETALQLISLAGYKYTSSSDLRVSFPSNAKELAADDIMKCSIGSLMGLAMFYTWPEKFSEIFDYDPGSVFPDTNPPSLDSACIAVQANMRNILRKVNMAAPKVLIISRSDKDPYSKIKGFWYRILNSESSGCSSCLKTAMSFELNFDMRIGIETRCDMGHVVINKRMKQIKMLTASNDRILKDCKAFEGEPTKEVIINTIPESYASVEVLSKPNINTSHCLDCDLSLRPIANRTWCYASQLPTNSKCRVYETLSVMKYSLKLDLPSSGIVFGDGLGSTSRILSSHFPNSQIKCASLHDSERAIPQSYPHILIPENPRPGKNLNYGISKMVYNDILSEGFVERWRDWVSGGFCWFEIESKEDKEQMIEKLLLLSDWEMMIIRSDFSSYDESARVINKLNERAESLVSYITGSLDVENLEILIFCENVSMKNCYESSLTGELMYWNYNLAADQLYEKAGSLLYAESLVRIEDQHEISRMIRRCDHWFAQVGLTHLLSCKSLFTSMWWDLQTGKIPSIVKDLGENKTYYLYTSDLIALQARLISLAISLIADSEEYCYERENFSNWKLIIEKGERGKIVFCLRRSRREVNYGPDHLKIIKFVPILRKLNNLHRRWWRFMPDSIEFTTNKSTPGFWVSRISNMIPTNLPEYK